MPITRRAFLKGSTAAATAVVAVPWVQTSFAAGKLALGLWDHWVPGANDVLRKTILDWAEKARVEIQLDFITSIGSKNLLTAQAEAQARTGHDIMAHPTWQVSVHRALLEPVDDVIGGLSKKFGAPNGTVEFLAKHDGRWLAIPTTVGSQVKPCCSRLDLYKQHAGIDLQKIFPASDKRDKALTDTWSWDTYLSSAEKLAKAGFPVGNPLGQTSDAVDWVGALFRAYGVVLADGKDNIKVNSPETRAVLEYAKKLAAAMPKDVYAWDDAGNNRWLISGKGSGIMNPPSAWAVAKRDNPKLAEQCWTHDMPKGPKGRFVGYLPYFWGIWSFSKAKPAAKELLAHLSEKEQAHKFVNASQGYDIPPFKSYYDFDIWQKEGPPVGSVFNYPPRGDEETNVAGYPARPAVAAQIYTQALMVNMVSKVSQGGEPIDAVIKWAEGELEGYLRG
ncbi:MAG TPA: extracellular solute-binding protein [Methylomirabilota bacterium]|nr:extracellular solute-binding protein [Methylomirabilota bacterium]